MKEVRGRSLVFCLILLCGFALPARGGALEDALDCLKAREKAEAERDLRLRAADSLGRRIESLSGTGREVPQEWLRSGEKIQRSAMDQELEWVSRRMRCRELAEKALVTCQSEIGTLEAEIRASRGGREHTERLLYLQGARTLLEAELTGPVTLGYPLLAVDSTDTQEVLRGKLQYYRDVRGDLLGLTGRVTARLDRITEERRTLAEAQRFIRDLGFLGEGGRALPGTLPQVPGGAPTGQGLDLAWSRVSPDSAGRIPSSRDLELILGLTPATPEQSDRLTHLLKWFQKEIGKEVDTVDQEIGKLEKRILPADGKP